jgi:hypothetical protein
MGLLACMLAGYAMVSAPVRAQDSPTGTEDTRFSLFRTEDGYLRLDGRTGQASICTRRQSRWLCQVVPDERAALKAEMARLQREGAALKSELLAHHLPLPRGLRPDSGFAPVADAPPREPAARGLDRIKGVVASVWRRLVALIAGLQKDLLSTS